MSHDPADLGDVVLAGAISAFRSSKASADKAIDQTSNRHMHLPPDENTNSIVVIMKHVAGNLRSRWTDFLTTDGEKPWRDRDNEFVDDFESREQLMECWNGGWVQLFTTLESLQSADLAKTVTIRGQTHSVPLAIHRSLAHCGYHCGQIIMIARMHAGDDWQTISIPRGQSDEYNDRVWGKDHYGQA